MSNIINNTPATVKQLKEILDTMSEDLPIIGYIDNGNGQGMGQGNGQERVVSFYIDNYLNNPKKKAKDIENNIFPEIALIVSIDKKIEV